MGMTDHDTSESASGLPEPLGQDLASALENALREKEENHKNWQRALADYQNLRRRQRADVEDAVRQGKRSLASELLLVLDFLDLALAAPKGGEDAQALRAGVELTRAQLWSALEREGLARIDASGTFDPTQHDCVERVETEAHPAGAVVDQLRPGYAWNGTVLRPAQVRVAVPRESGAAETD
jgi:molecular chaperone GrpE